MKSKNINIPNFLTTLNLLFGCCAIYFIFGSNFSFFLYCFIISLILDSVDGWYARYSCTETLFGKKYDAFVDVFSFGLIITVLIYKQIFIKPLFWQVLLAGWFTFANIIRYVKLTTIKDDKVYGVPNVVISIFIIALYNQTAITLSLNQWSYIIAIASLLMLLPIEFINHKTLKNILLPKKKAFVLLLFFPLLTVPIINHPMLWNGITVVSGVYISSILFSIARLIKQMYERESKSQLLKTYSNKILFMVEHGAYSLITVTIIVLRIFSFKL